MKTSKKEIERIKGFRAKFPKEVEVSVLKTEDGKYCAEVLDFKGCFTEADTFSGLIEMVNDAIRLYLDVPEKYSSHMPEYLPPIELAQCFNIFPSAIKRVEVEFNINEAVKC